MVIVPESNPAGVESLQDLDTFGIKLVLAQEGVPAAEYAENILDNASSEYGENFEREVLSNVVSREAHVRAAVNRVALGDADATFGYASDITSDMEDRFKGYSDTGRVQRNRHLPDSRARWSRQPGSRPRVDRLRVE